MGKVVSHMTMSLDGFVADPDDGVAELFGWYNASPVTVPSANGRWSFKVDERSAQMLRQAFPAAGQDGFRGDAWRNCVERLRGDVDRRLVRARDKERFACEGMWTSGRMVHGHLAARCQGPDQGLRGTLRLRRGAGRFAGTRAGSRG